MRIKLHTILAGPAGALLPGEHEVGDKVGLELCTGGYAESLEAGQPRGFPPIEALGGRPPIESAAIEPAEHAVLPKPNKHKPKAISKA